MTIGQSKSEYLLGMEAAEVDRLRRQHEIWQSDTDRVLQQAEIQEGDRVVDLGCGPGFTTFDLLDRVGPSGHVTAIDSSDRALATLEKHARESNRTNLTIINADISDIDFSEHRADIYFARWFFSFVREPESVIANIAQAMPEGSQFVAIDYWNYHGIYIEPADPLFKTVFEAVYRSYAETGGSLDVGGILPGICERNGIAVQNLVALNHAIRPGSPYWSWIDEFQHLYLPGLVDKGHLTEQELRQHFRNWKKASTSAETVLFLPPMLGTIALKN